MKVTYLYIFFLLSHTHNFANLITNETKCLGRFGDQAIAYLNAMWASYQKNVPFLYTPICHSQTFVLHYRQKHMTQRKEAQYTISKHEQHLSDIVNDNRNILYKVGYVLNDDRWPTFEIDTANVQERFDAIFTAFKKEKTFFNEIKKLMKPMGVVRLCKPSKQEKSIALHIRTGGIFEAAEQYVFSGILSSRLYSGCKKNCRRTVAGHAYLRFLPLEWYVQQVIYLRDILKEDLYVFVFTDDSNPSKIVDFLENIIEDHSIRWDCRKKDNQHDRNIAQDLWAMAQCDYLIRPWSQFSRLAEFLGDHKQIIFPVKHVETDADHNITTAIRSSETIELKNEIIAKQLS